MRAGVPTTDHRRATVIGPAGNQTHGEYRCTAPGCDWRGSTREAFYRHLYELTLKRGEVK